MKKLAPVGLLVVIASSISTLYKNSLREEESLNPKPELCIIAKHLYEVPFGSFSVLFNAVQ
jgi:hypothetical protein